ncbi:MAG: hypothetical protein ACJ8F7_14735 [Gemmataceae bacterium]
MPLRRSFMIIGALAAWTAAIQADDRADPRRTLDAKSLAAVRSTAHRLTETVDDLQEAIVEDLHGEKRTTLYRLAEEVLADLKDFQTCLKADVAREDVYKRFERLDAKVHPLLEHFQSLGANEQALVRPARRMQFVTDELHYTLSLADPAKSRVRQALERQARDLVVATQSLQRTAEFSIGDTQARGAVLGDLTKLTQEAQTVNDNLEKKAPDAVITRDCQRLTATWTRVITGIRVLSRKENIYLTRTAARVDLLHERVFHLARVTGECPHLLVEY